MPINLIEEPINLKYTSSIPIKFNEGLTFWLKIKNFGQLYMALDELNFHQLL